MNIEKRLAGERIQRFLDENLKTREWLAVELGVSLALVSLMIAGRSPKVSTIEALAKVMGIPAAELLTDGDLKSA